MNQMIQNTGLISGHQFRINHPLQAMRAEGPKRDAGKTSHGRYIKASFRLHTFTFSILKSGDYKGLERAGHNHQPKDRSVLTKRHALLFIEANTSN
jgi:hypothetical protein